MDPFRFVLIGTGNIAGTYVNAIGKLDGVEIAAVVSREVDRPDVFAAENGIGASGTDLADLEVDFDAVVTCTPNGKHHEGVIAAAALGKHALAEKPLDVTGEAMDRMIAACNDANVTLACCYHRRTRQNNQIVKDLLDDDAFGRIYAVDLSMKLYRPQEYYDSGAWRGTKALDGGGPFIQQGSHDIDLLCWLFGRPTSVVAKCGTFGHTGIEVEDHGAAVCEMPGGGIASIVASTVARPGWPVRMDVMTERGTFSMVNDVITFWEIEGMDNPGIVPAGEQHSSMTASVSDTSGHEAILTDLVEAVRTGRDPLVTGASARVATDVIHAIYRASEEGAQIAL